MTSRKSAPSPARSRLRCAIYTRKSSEEGLEQEFNSLHPQREACEAYVQSQAGEGWAALPAAYDDGGFSGGSMARPGLEKLLQDVDARRIDVVVVYKVDRLTRSLADFAKIVERFDAAGVSFVSVTQAFNTTSSMGRLTLNVLLSFAQFEREVTGERIRDKIAASKAKGMWMGGLVPLGYDAEDHKLIVNETEAEQVRHIFRRYLELGSVHALRDELEVQGVRSKRRVSRNGRVSGDAVFGRGALFHLLSNRHYLGEIVHKETSYPGAHPPIIDRGLFEEVQAELARKAGPARGTRPALHPGAPSALLTGLIFDDRGNAMTPICASKGKGRLYRYYVSSATLQGRRDQAGSLARCPAPLLEELLRDRVERLGLGSEADAIKAAVDRIEIGRRQVRIHFRRSIHDLRATCLAAADHLASGAGGAVLTVPSVVRWRGGAKHAISPDGHDAVQHHQVDLSLLKALVRAVAWAQRIQTGDASFDQIVEEERVNKTYAQRLIRLAFLAPEIKRNILEGHSLGDVTLTRLLQGAIPLAWADQRRLFSPHSSTWS